MASKQYKLDDDGFGVTVIVLDGPAAGEYETDLNALQCDTINGIWDTRRNIKENGKEKHLKLNISDFTQLPEWIAAFEATAGTELPKCCECGASIPKGREIPTTRMFRGTLINLVLCDCCGE